MRIYFMGSFPPPYGGVTIKNENLLRGLRECGPANEIRRINFSLIKKGNLPELFRLVFALLDGRGKYIVGIAGRKYRKAFIRLLYYINRRAMKRSILILMGGLAAGDIVSDPGLCRCASEFQKIFCETESMVRLLKDHGLKADYYPNGRFCSKVEENQPEERQGELKTLFFSRICREKGCHIILEAARQLPNISFTFYGPIQKDFQGEFLSGVDGLANVTYKGLFQEKDDLLYRELAKYDLVLLPTSHAAEGVPGVLVEGKIAGLAAIVSDIAYNGEIVENGISGILLEQNNSTALAEALSKLDQDRSLLAFMKKNSRSSAEKYYIDNYIDTIVAEL